MNDDELHALIRQSQPQPKFHASFQREVWTRIAAAEQYSWTARWQRWRQELLLWVARPAPALATVMITLGLGLGLGGITAPDDSAAERAAYVASINPLKAGHTAMPE